jgi:hypothetical protein
MYALREDDHVILHCDNYESNALLIAMAPDLAARVLELEADNKRLREGLSAIVTAGNDEQIDYGETLEAVLKIARAALKGGEI